MGAAIIPAATSAIGAVGSIVSGLSSLFGNTAAAKQWAQRAATILQYAAQGNVHAAQCLLGGASPAPYGPHDTKEQQMYQAALQQLQASPVGVDALQQAQSLGPYWSGESAANWPTMLQFIQSWSGLPTTVTNALQGLGVSPASAQQVGQASAGLGMPLVVGGVLAAALLLRKKS